MGTQNENTENGAMAAVMEELGGAELTTFESVDGTKIPVAIVPRGKEVKSIKALADQYRTAPERIAGTARLDALDSFIAHVLRFKGEATAIFAKGHPNPSLTVVYDYHAKDAPAFGVHRASFAFPLSKEWKAWTEKDGKLFSQADFAAWMEEHAAEVVGPDNAAAAKEALERIDLRVATPGEVLTLSRGLEVRVQSTVAETQRLQTGETRIVYENEVKGAKGEALNVPGGFIVAVPIFDGDVEAQAVPVRLRLRAQNGVITWGIALLGADDVLRAAVDEAVARVADATGVPVFRGAPESDKA